MAERRHVTRPEGYDVDPLRVAELRSGRSGIEDVPDAAVTGYRVASPERLIDVRPRRRVPAGRHAD